MAILRDNTSSIRSLLENINNLPLDRYDEGYSNGYKEGYDEGLAARTYETWTITLTDGTIVEKEVALL